MKATTRRDLLKAGLTTGAALAFPAIVPRSVFGKNAPSERVNVGQIGCGSLAGYYHIPILARMEDVRIVAVADAYTSRREAAAKRINKKYGDKQIARAHDDFREILERADVDAVVIAAHDNWHTPMSIAAAKAGKDVYCQKPLCLDLTRTALLRQVVNENQRVFQFGTQYRSQGRYRLMVELVRNGYIGDLKRIDVWSREVTFNADRYHVKPYGSTEEVPVPADLDFDAWQGPSPMVPYTVDRCTNWGGFHCPETSLGFMAGCAIHPLGIAQWGNKSDHTSPVRYEGAGMVPNEGIYRTLARWDMKCDYENGVTLQFMDTLTAQKRLADLFPKWRHSDGVFFHGTKGWIGAHWGWESSDKTIWKTEFQAGDERLPVSKEHNRNFIDCVKSREATMCPVEMAIRCDTICHMTDVAARTGRVIHWDPKQEKIVGDDEAEKMITRPYRDKWKVW